MSQASKPHEELSPLKRAFLALEKAQTRIESLERSRHEGIAIVGMSCRFPGGVNSPKDYWKLLSEGRDAVTEVPPSRWDIDALFDPDPDAPGKVCSRFGGFIDNVDRFDAALFGISPREAESLDPQQRLLLEVAQEAFEDGGVAGDGLLGSSTGVFAGLANGDYYCLLTGNTRDRIDAYTGTGTSPNSAAGRVSYVFGLRGPCVAIDTACSSSLVAIHLACQSLRNGECNMALAGGVNVMLAPDLSITFSKAHMLCLDGRCKTFDAAANGYVRGEGVGLILLKRLSDALADGDRILAVIRGSAINHAGASGGLTVPNGPAQQEVIQRALALARLHPDDIDYVEAHGTGTALGDPIEVGALGAVFAGRQNPLWIASVKTNLGHMEAAAGIAGVIKVVLALEHGEIPPHLHFQTPSPRIPWQNLPVRVPTRREPWPAGARHRVAGVSSFGFSGINAHVVIEEAPVLADSPRPLAGEGPGAACPGTTAKPRRSHHLLPLSARHPDALRQMADSYAQRLTVDQQLRLEDICFTASVGRGQFEHRLALIAQTADEARDRLQKFGAGEPCEGIYVGQAGAESGKVAMLFGGDDSPWHGLGPGLYDSEPAFRAAIDQCAESLRKHVDRPLTEILFSTSSAGAVPDQPVFSHPARFALQYATAQLWQSWGVRSTVLLGQGVGEYVAACLAGVFSLEDGLRLMAARSRALQDAAPMDSVARSVAYARPRRRLICCATGELADEAFCRAEYWCQPNRPADLSRCIGPLASVGVDTLLEIGPATGLLQRLRSCWLAAGCEGVPRWLCGLAANRPDEQTLLENLAELYVAGAAVDWQAATRPFAGRKVSLPTYPFQRRRFWVQASDERVGGEVDASAGPVHPLLGRRILLAAASDVVQFESRLSSRRPALLKEHRLAGMAIMPAAGFFEIPLAAASEVEPHRKLVVEGVVLAQALPFAEGQSRVVQMAVRSEAASYRFELYSRPTRAAAMATSWTLHARGRLVPAPQEKPVPDTDLDALKRRCADEVPLAGFYDQLGHRGLDYGLLFRGLKRLWRGEREALGQVELSPEAQSDAGDYLLYPPLLDACLHVTANLIDPRMDNASEAPVTYVPVGVDRIHYFASPGATTWSHARLRNGDASQPASRYAIDVDLLDPEGNLLARLEGLQVQQVDLAALGEELVQREKASQTDASGSLADQIIRLPASQQRQRVTEFLEAQVARILKLPRNERPAHHRNLFELGLDSLMSVELLYRINESMRINLSMQSLVDNAAITPLADVIVREIGSRGPATVVDVASTPTAAAPANAARVRLLVCAPPDDASTFTGWSDALRPSVEVCPIQIPAKAEAASPLQDWSSLVETVAEQAIDLLDRPFALFGYGSGSLWALELAHTIRERFGLSPVHLIVGASHDPESTAGQGTCQGYSYRPRPPLECSLTALAGTDDETCGRNALVGWQNHTQGSFRLELLRGTFASHLESPAGLLRVIRRDLEQA